MVEESPLEHPAVAAWLALDSTHRRPDSVFALFDAISSRKKPKVKKKSAVYRLVSAASAGSDIVAKRCSSATAQLERVIYEEVLAELPVSSLKYFGSVDTSDGFWLFLDYAHGVEWRFENETHLELAIQWLARMHYGSAQLDSISQLPDRGPSYYRSQLDKAEKRIADSYSNPALRSSDTKILDHMIEQTERIDPHWPEIQSFCQSMPVALVHNDFARKNVHVRDTEIGPVLLPFDWEMSGKGVPAVDLNWMFLKAPASTVGRYHDQIRDLDSKINRGDVEYMALIGAIFRTLDAIEWSSHHLITPYPLKQVSCIKKYTERLKSAYAALGWS